MQSAVAHNMPAPVTAHRRSWRLDVHFARITLTTAADGASRSAHVSLRLWPMQRAMVASVSFVAMWS